ncbi:MAG: hypothetical protein ACFFCZ_07270 [Promethearchaeota archaeon]
MNEGTYRIFKILLIISLILCISSNVASSQPVSAKCSFISNMIPDLVIKLYGGLDNDTASAIIRTDDCGYAIAGTTESFVAGKDGYLVKVDSNGDLEWENNYGGKYDDSFASLVQTDDGGYIVAGTTKTYGQGKGLDSIWLLKFSSNGILEWDRTFWEEGIRSASSSVFMLSDGRYAIGGVWRNRTAYIWHDQCWLLIINPDGTLDWETKFGNPGWYMTPPYVLTADDGFALTTYFFPGESGNFYLTLLHANGSIEWQKKYVVGGSSLATTLAQTQENGFVLAGTTENTNKYSCALLKTDSNGEEEWHNSYDLNLSWGSKPSKVLELSDGGYAFVISNQTSGSEKGILLVKTNATGEMEWYQDYGLATTDVAVSMIETFSELAIIGTTVDLGNKDIILLLQNTTTTCTPTTYISETTTSIPETSITSISQTSVDTQSTIGIPLYPVLLAIVVSVIYMRRKRKRKKKD